jgi:hypothetical protein
LVGEAELALVGVAVVEEAEVSEVAVDEAGETCTGPRACRAGRVLGCFPAPVWVRLRTEAA